MSNLFAPVSAPTSGGKEKKPLPALKIPPSTSKGNGKPADVPDALWAAILVAAKKYGVTPQVLAGIWRVESGSTYPNPSVNSLGYGGLFGTKNWKASTQAQANTSAQILREQIRQTGNLHDALLAYSGGGYSDVPGVSVPRTPAQQAADEARLAGAKAASPGYVQATTDLSVVKSQALAAAKATAHISDPWVVVQRRGNKIVGLGESTGENPPANVLKIGGMPATNSMYQQAWSNVYASDYAAYTGNQATPAVQVDILQRGISAYTLREELSRQPGFVSSPIYKANGPGIADQAKQVLGAPAPPDLVRQAIAQGWDAATFQAHLRALPQYTKGPEFRNNLAENQTTYQSIYGTADAEAQGWLKHATLQGWSPTAVGHALRSDPAYKYSPEYQSKAIGFLDAMGAITGTHPVAGLAMPEAVAQQTARSKVGGVAPAPLQVSTVGG